MWQFVYELTPYGTNLIQSAINRKDDIIVEVTENFRTSEYIE